MAPSKSSKVQSNPATKSKSGKRNLKAPSTASQNGNPTGRAASKPPNAGSSKHSFADKANPPTKSAPILLSGTRMRQAVEVPSIVPVRPKLLKRFYEAVVLLSMLGTNRGDPTEEEFEMELEISDLGPTNLRRSFTRHISYLCDYEKGGDTTTAIALERTSGNIIYHLASNKCPGPGSPRGDLVKVFLEQILSILRESLSSAATQAEDRIFAKAVDFSMLRISEYSRLLKDRINVVLGHLAESSSLKDIALCTFLQKLRSSLHEPKTLCEFCYDNRRSPDYKYLSTKTANSDHFDTIRHSIGRLSHTMKAVKVIVSVSMQLPQLVMEFAVKRAASSTKSRPPLQERNPSLFSIAGRMLSNPGDIEQHREWLQDLDRTAGLSRELRERCTDKAWKPRVHAEIILADIFWTRNLDFVDSDRYIGCSKPACYCCYEYLFAHRGRFVPPACHKNLYLNWKPPDILSTDPDRDFLVKARENILNDMVKRIREDALDQIVTRRAPNRRRPDSRTEISSVRFETPDLSLLGFQDAEQSFTGDRSSSPGSATSSVVGYDASNDTPYVVESESESESECSDSDGGVEL